MKKKLNILLAGLMLLGLASCNNGVIGSNEGNKPTATLPNDTGGTTTPTEENPAPIGKKTIANDGRVGYQIFVNTFADGNKKNNGKLETGDINGIIDNLDYLKDNLNVDILWLTPIHQSPSYNGYDVIDYETVRYGFGGMKAYERLLEEAHKRGMYVMLDLVINHTSLKSGWFFKSSNNDPKYRDYYRWTDTKVTDSRYFMNGSYYYAVFWDQMPDLNYDNPEVYNEMLRICKGWIDKGVDGFRVDGAKHVYNYDNWGGKELYEGASDLGKLNWEKNLEFFNKFNKDIKAYDKDQFITLEVLDYSSDATSPYLKQGVDSCFDFSTRINIINNIKAGNGGSIANGFQADYAKYNYNNPTGVNSLVLGNHDMNRILSEFNDNDGQARAAAAIEMLLPGISWIYSGDELGMTGKHSGHDNGDMMYRQPYKWGNEYTTSLITLNGQNNGYDEHNKSLKPALEQLNDKNSMLSFYKDITNLKSNDDVIAHGDFNPADLNNNAVTGFTRSYNGKTYLCAINTRGDNQSVSYNLNGVTEIYTKDSSITSTEIKLGAYGVAVIELKEEEAPLCDEIVVHYKGPKGFKLLDQSSSPARWISFNEIKDGYQIAKINVKDKKLSSFKFLIGKDGKNGIEVQYPSEAYKITPKNKIFDIYIDDTATEFDYSIDIASGWGFNSSTQKLAIWAWETGGAGGKWYNTTISGGKVSFTLPKNMDNMIIVIFDKSSELDWNKKLKQTNDLKISRGIVKSEITWQ